jgi:aminomethyltransferase
MEQAAATLRKTPLNARHVALGARMVPFAGWDMPVEYTGLAEEHLAVRTRAAIFDVSHMGEIEIAGDDALAGLQRVSANDAARLDIGQTQYSALTTPEGTFVDDLLVYRLAKDHFLLVVNAANTERDFRWIAEHTKPAGDVVAVNSSSRYALLAVQGPEALGVLQTLTSVNLNAIAPRHFAAGEVAGVRVTISRTGYTGEDGFEIFAPPQAADRLWTAIVEAGKPVKLAPAGLGARDTLRLEAALRLYGQDINESATVIEAGLGWIVGWDKPDFIGRDALLKEKEAGPRRRLVGFELAAPGIARHGHEVCIGGERVGIVTSGTQTPFLKKSIGLAYVPSDRASAGTALEIDIRGRRALAHVVPLPFYRR